VATEVKEKKSALVAANRRVDDAPQGKKGDSEEIAVITQADEELIKEVRMLHDENVLARKNTLGRAIQIGEILSKEKAKRGHGKWLPFVKQLGFSERIVQNYLRIYKNREQFKSEDFSDLRISAANRRLRGKGQDDPKSAEIPDQRSGTSPTNAETHGDGESLALPAAAGPADVEMESTPIATDATDEAETGEPESGSASRPASESVKSLTDGKSDAMSFQLVDRPHAFDWHKGFIEPEWIQKEVNQVTKSRVKAQLEIQAAEQHVLVTCAIEINRVCGANPSREQLDAAEYALMTCLNGLLRKHPNYIKN
jgi:hypothetical protein